MNFLTHFEGRIIKFAKITVNCKLQTLICKVPLLLSIDTSTRGCSVALHQDGHLLSSYELLADKSSSGMLTTLIHNAVDHAGYQLAEVDAFAVAQGPGSYTGLRIAVSTAKGLCFALDKPLIAINTLEAMALQVKLFFETNYLLCPMLDARRMEVFCALFDCELKFVEPTQAKIIDQQSFAGVLEEYSVVFFGDGAEKCRQVLGQNPNAYFLSHVISPSAKTVGELAWKRFQNQQFEEIATFEPFYLKDFMATTPKSQKHTN